MPLSEALAEPCPECGGRGWVVVADGRAGTARPCACRERDVVPRLIAAAGIPDRYRACRISNLQVASPSPEVRNQLLRARTVAQRYVDEFLGEGGFTKVGLIFTGPPGGGKTHLAVGVLVELIERYRIRGRFVELNALINQIQGTFSPTAPETTQEVLNPVLDAPFLVLDELGTQQTTPWVQDVLYLIINTRYTRRLPTLFTTNYRLSVGQDPAARSKSEKVKSLDRGADPEAEPRKSSSETAPLASRLSAMIVSRIHEMAKPVI
ncbi:MAG TPA: ATP-binding protein, partial [Thermoanaerobaculia bacterium]